MADASTFMILPWMKNSPCMRIYRGYFYHRKTKLDYFLFLAFFAAFFFFPPRTIFAQEMSPFLSMK